jgi:hypothetical protein
MSGADQVVQGERASDRQRRETRGTIRRAWREGRISDDIYEVRRKSVERAGTTAELRQLTSDLGESEGPDLRHVPMALCCLLVALAAWEPFLLSGRLAWLVLAVPVTLLTPLIWVFREYLA